MGNCLVTKMKGSVDNSELLRYGEFRIGISKVSSPTQWTQGLCFEFNKDTKLEIIGDGYFTDKTLTSNNGKSLVITAKNRTNVFVCNGDFEIAVFDKYSLTYYNDYGEYVAGKTNTNVYNKSLVDIDVFKYTSLTYLSLVNTQVSGDIAAVKNLTSLTSISLGNTQVSGDIAAVKNLTSLTYLYLGNTQVSGDIAAVKNLTSLTSISLGNTQVSGDIAAVKNLTSLITCELKGVNNVTGDLGELPDSLLFISNSNGNSQFTWNNNTRKYVLATEGVICDSIDKMLQDMSTLEAKFGGDSNWYKTIQLRGSRTSASNDAISALQSKGYTVVIYNS